MRYAVPMFLLLFTLAGFFLVARGRFRELPRGQLVLRVAVALPLLLSGLVLHFLRTAQTASTIPPGFPYPRALVWISGVLEIGGAIALFFPLARKLNGILLAVMMVAIFPANIYAAGRVVGGLTMPGVPMRTGMQMVFILMILTSSFGLPHPINKADAHRRERKG